MKREKAGKCSLLVSLALLFVKDWAFKASPMPFFAEADIRYWKWGLQTVIYLCGKNHLLNVTPISMGAGQKRVVRYRNGFLIVWDITKPDNKLLKLMQIFFLFYFMLLQSEPGSDQWVGLDDLQRLFQPELFWFCDYYSALSFCKHTCSCPRKSRTAPKNMYCWPPSPEGKDLPAPETSRPL